MQKFLTCLVNSITKATNSTFLYPAGEFVASWLLLVLLKLGVPQPGENLSQEVQPLPRRTVQGSRVILPQTNTPNRVKGAAFRLTI